MPSPASRSRRRRIAYAVFVLVAALLAGTLSISMGISNANKADPAAGADAPAEISETEQEPMGPDLARRNPGDSHAIGRVDAPVVLVEYADFQCPFCGKFARDTKPELVKEYVDKGVLRIEWRHFPIFGKESEDAALAAYAAGRQKKFWEFHDVAYAKDHKRGSGAFSEKNLIAMARKAGVPDLERFRADMKSEAARKAIERDREEAYGLGATSTPAFLVNGEPILGAQPVEIFRDAIDRAKARAGKNDNNPSKAAEDGGAQGAR